MYALNTCGSRPLGAGSGFARSGSGTAGERAVRASVGANVAPAVAPRRGALQDRLVQRQY